MRGKKPINTKSAWPAGNFEGDSFIKLLTLLWLNLSAVVVATTSLSVETAAEDPSLLTETIDSVLPSLLTGAVGSGTVGSAAVV